MSIDTSSTSVVILTIPTTGEYLIMLLKIPEEGNGMNIKKVKNIIKSVKYMFASRIFEESMENITDSEKNNIIKIKRNTYNANIFFI